MAYAVLRVFMRKCTLVRMGIRSYKSITHHPDSQTEDEEVGPNERSQSSGREPKDDAWADEEPELCRSKSLSKSQRVKSYLQRKYRSRSKSASSREKPSASWYVEGPTSDSRTEGGTINYARIEYLDSEESLPPRGLEASAPQLSCFSPEIDYDSVPSSHSHTEERPPECPTITEPSALYLDQLVLALPTSDHTNLQTEDGGSKLEAMVDRYFGCSYPNYNASKPTLIRQARDLLVTKYMGSLARFESEFCHPASRIARRLSLNPAIQWWEGCWCGPGGWPLSVCRGRGVLLHLGELDSSYLQEGEGYLCLDPELQLRLKSSGAVLTVPLDSLALSLGPPSSLAMDDSLVDSLRSLVVSVERALERLPVERLAFPCASCGLLDPSCSCPDHAPPPTTRDSSIQTSPIYELDASIPHIDSDEEHEPNSQGGCNVVACLRPARRLCEIPDVHLNAGIYLPGLHDVEGRALIVFDPNAVNRAGLSPPECARLVIYYSTMPIREERLRHGVSIVCLDGPLEILDQCLTLLQGQVRISSVLLFTPQTHGYSRNILPESQTEVVELKTRSELEMYIPEDQVPYLCGGPNTHDQPAWVEFFKEVECMKERCCEAGRHLVGLMGDLSGCDPFTKTVHQQTRSVARFLHDTELVRLRREAPAVISALANQASLSIPHSEDSRLSVEKIGRLFSEVDRTVRRLEELAEKRREKLKDISKIRALEHETEQVLSWLSHKGDDWLRKHSDLANNLPALKQQEVDFEKFYFISMRHLDKGGDLVEEASQVSGNNSSGLRDLARTLKSHLLGFSDRLEDTRERLEDTSRCFYLLDRAYEWALEAMKYMSRVKPEEGGNPEQSCKQLKQYLMAHPPPTPDHFAEMNALAAKLDTDKLIQQCKAAQMRCEETVEQVRSVLGCEGVTRWASSTPLPGRRKSAPCGPPTTCNSTACISSPCLDTTCGTLTAPSQTQTLPPIQDITDDCLCRPVPLHRSSTWQYPTENFDDEDKLSSSADNTTEGSESGTKSGEDMDDHNESYGVKPPCPIPVNSHLHSDLSVQLDVSGGTQTLKNKKTMLLIMREMIQTERDYVQSLEYVIENYIPELVRDDIPQAMRGQRNVIFGNIEKIYEFHSQYFLQELERCENSPLHVGQCFLKYENKFYLYALYNKNKPKSDSLMSEYGTIFFKGKQMELGDKMDLASYLLKPVQRMGKYALLLQQLMKAWPRQEVQELRAAETMVRFQLRHGNDLLAMDSLRDCDVNVKEQGRLLRQNEFLVWQGKNGKKYYRHVFLFEELILFSKAKRFPDRKNLDIYIYKSSIKTSDIGLTAKVGDSSTKFEIWFRKRKPNDTFTLQSISEEIKQSWTEELSKLLWKQALRNREMRMIEMSSMGIGNKPCLDIRPSVNQISDRSISITQLSKTAPRFRNSIAVSPVEHVRKRPHSIISVSSSSGSSTSGSSSSGSVGSSNGEHKHSQCSSAESGIVSDWTPQSQSNLSLKL